MLRLSPNEEARLLAEETARRRRERLAQVREKSRAHASMVRNAVKAEKCKQLQELASKIEADWEEEKALRISQLLQLQDACLRAIGQGHTAARNWDPGNEERVRLMMEDNERAEQRHRAALERLRKEQAELDETSRRSELQRLMAREKERLRAKHIASLPRRSPDPVLTALGTSDPSRAATDACRWDVAREAHGTQDAEPGDSDSCVGKDNDALEPDVLVERASPADASRSRDSGLSTSASDGRKAAAIMEARLAREREEAARKESERREAARLRHRHALHKEVLHQDYQQLLTELDDLQRADRRRRQQVLERIPRSLYLPPHVVLEKAAERQVEMERQFEELYESVAGNIADVRSLATEVGPLGGTPTASDDTDSAAAAADYSTCGVAAAPSSAASPALVANPRQTTVEAPLKDVTNVVAGAPAVSRASSDSAVRPQQKRAALNKLIAKIHDQKSSWMMAQSTQSDEGSETAVSDASHYERTIASGRDAKAAGVSSDVMQEIPLERHVLSSPGLSTVSSGNVHPSSTDALTTPTLSQYTIESSSDAAEQVADRPVGTSRKHGAYLQAAEGKSKVVDTSTLLAEAEKLKTKRKTAEQKNSKVGESGHWDDGRNDDGPDDDNDDSDHQMRESEEPVEWIEKQKRTLRQRLDAIAAQRHALQNLQTAARHRLRLAGEAATGFSSASADACDRSTSERERRVREYQQQLLSRGLGSERRSALTQGLRHDEPPEFRRVSPGKAVKGPVPMLPSSSAVRGHAAVDVFAAPEQAVSSRQPSRLAAAAVATRARTAPPESRQRLPDDPITAAVSFRQPEVVDPLHQSLASSTAASDRLLSDDAGDLCTDSSVDLSSIPGYIPPAQREALLMPHAVHAAGVDSILKPHVVAAPSSSKFPTTSPDSKSIGLISSSTSRLASAISSQPPALGTLSLEKPVLHPSAGTSAYSATAAPSAAVMGRGETHAYISIEERERLLAELDQTPTVHRPSIGKFLTSSARDAPFATAADVDTAAAATVAATSQRPSAVSVGSSKSMAAGRPAEQPPSDGRRTAAATGIRVPQYVVAAGSRSSDLLSDSWRTAGSATSTGTKVALPTHSEGDDVDATVAAKLNPTFRPRHEQPKRATSAAIGSADELHDDSAATSAILSAALAQQMLERQLAFNGRQEELRRQLAEIQRQKSEILLRYQLPKTASPAGAAGPAASAVGLVCATKVAEELDSRRATADVAGHVVARDSRSEPRSGGSVSQLYETIPAAPDEQPSASRHFLSTIEEVDDAESKLESGTESSRDYDDESNEGPRTKETTAQSSPHPDRSSITRHAEQQTADTPSWDNDKSENSDLTQPVVSLPLLSTSSSSPAASSIGRESRPIQDRYPPEVELSSGTLATTNSSSSAGTSSSYNPLPLDCSEVTITDPSSGSTNDLIIENSFWPSRPYEGGTTAGDRAAPVGGSGSSAVATASSVSSPSSVSTSSCAAASSLENAATSKLIGREASLSSLSSEAGSITSFRPLALDESSSNTENGPGRSQATAGASSEGEVSSREPVLEMTDGVASGVYASREVVSLRYGERSNTSSQDISVTSKLLDTMGNVGTTTIRPLAEADDADYVDFAVTRPPSSTPMKYPPSASAQPLGEDADGFGELVLNTSVASSLSSVPDILQEPELTFITMSASSALEESDLPNVTLTPDELLGQHHEAYSSSTVAPDRAAVTAERRTAGTQRPHQSEATAGTARRAGAVHLKTQRAKKIADAVVITTSDRKKHEQENRLRTKLLYERLEEVQAQKQAKAREQMRLQAPTRRSEYDAKLKQRKRVAQQAKDSS